MTLPKEIDALDASYHYYSRRRLNKHLLMVREQSREVNQQLFDLCCKLQKQFDVKDLEQVSVLVAELKTLKACEEELEHLDGFP